jgi:hypothetical protein
VVRVHPAVPAKSETYLLCRTNHLPRNRDWEDHGKMQAALWLATSAPLQALRGHCNGPKTSTASASVARPPWCLLLALVQELVPRRADTEEASSAASPRSGRERASCDPAAKVARMAARVSEADITANWVD